MDSRNKLVFVPGNPFQPSLMFADKARAYTSEPSFRYVALPTNIRLGWKSLPGTNSSLLRKFVNYVRKTFYNIDP
jgi:hypothetical protein